MTLRRWAVFSALAMAALLISASEAQGIEVEGGGSFINAITGNGAPPELDAQVGATFATPCHEDEVAIVMPHDWVPRSEDRWFIDANTRRQMVRACIALDDVLEER